MAAPNHVFPEQPKPRCQRVLEQPHDFVGYFGEVFSERDKLDSPFFECEVSSRSSEQFEQWLMELQLKELNRFETPALGEEARGMPRCAALAQRARAMLCALCDYECERFAPLGLQFRMNRGQNVIVGLRQHVLEIPSAWERSPALIKPPELFRIIQAVLGPLLVRSWTTIGLETECLGHELYAREMFLRSGSNGRYKLFAWDALAHMVHRTGEAVGFYLALMMTPSFAKNSHRETAALPSHIRSIDAPWDSLEALIRVLANGAQEPSAPEFAREAWMVLNADEPLEREKRLTIFREQTGQEGPDELHLLGLLKEEPRYLSVMHLNHWEQCQPSMIYDSLMSMLQLTESLLTRPYDSRAFVCGIPPISEERFQALRYFPSGWTSTMLNAFLIHQRVKGIDEPQERVRAVITWMLEAFECIQWDVLKKEFELVSTPETLESWKQQLEIHDPLLWER